MHRWRHTNTKTRWFNWFSFLKERVSIDDRDQNINGYYNFFKIKARWTSELGGNVSDDLLRKAKQVRSETYVLRVVHNIAASGEGLCYSTGRKREVVLGCILCAHKTQVAPQAELRHTFQAN